MNLKFQLEEREWEIFYQLTNKRKLRNNDSLAHKEKVIRGFQMYQNLIGRLK